jgi:hypothetical protein
METIGMETIGAIIAATVPLIILVWVWVVGRELDRQSNRLRELQTTLEELRAWLALDEKQRREEADPAFLSHRRFRRWQRAARRV